MATYFCSQNGAGLMDGTSPANAWTNYGGTNPPVWGTLDNDPNNVLYLLGAFTSRFTITSFTGTGITIRGDYIGQECTFDVVDTYCISASTQNYDISPMTIKNITVRGATTADVWIFNCQNIILDGIVGSGLNSPSPYGIWVYSNTNNITIQNCTLNYYTTSSKAGIDILANGAVTVQNIIIDNCTCNYCFQGVKFRTANGGATFKDGIIKNCTANDNQDAGIALRCNAGDIMQDIVIEYNTTNRNGTTSWGTGIELSGADATGVIYRAIVRFNYSEGNLDADSDGTDGVGMRFDDYVTDSLMYGNTSRNEITGFVSKWLNNYVYGNVAFGSTRSGFRYATIVGGTASSGYFYNNTAIDCELGYECLNAGADGGVIVNNIFKNCVHGMAMATGSTRTEAYNFFDNCTNNFTGSNTSAYPIVNPIEVTIDVTDIVGDALIDNAGIPDIGSPCYHAGKTEIFNLKDFKGHKFNNPPTIGAYEFTSGSVALDRIQA